MRAVGIRMPDDLFDKTNAVATKERRSMSAQIVIILEQYFAVDKSTQAAGLRDAVEAHNGNG